MKLLQDMISIPRLPDEGENEDLTRRLLGEGGKNASESQINEAMEFIRESKVQKKKDSSNVGAVSAGGGGVNLSSSSAGKFSNEDQKKIDEVMSAFNGNSLNDLDFGVDEGLRKTPNLSCGEKAKLIEELDAMD